MVTEALQDVFERIKGFPAEDQDRIAAALRVMIEQPPVTSDAVRPEVMDAFHEMLGKTSSVLDYLKDR